MSNLIPSSPGESLKISAADNSNNPSEISYEKPEPASSMTSDITIGSLVANPPSDLQSASNNYSAAASQSSSRLTQILDEAHLEDSQTSTSAVTDESNNYSSNSSGNSASSTAESTASTYSDFSIKSSPFVKKLDSDLYKLSVVSSNSNEVPRSDGKDLKTSNEADTANTSLESRTDPSHNLLPSTPSEPCIISGNKRLVSAMDFSPRPESTVATGSELFKHSSLASDNRSDLVYETGSPARSDLIVSSENDSTTNLPLLESSYRPRSPHFHHSSISSTGIPPLPGSELTNSLSGSDMPTPTSDLEDMSIEIGPLGAPETYDTHEARVRLIDGLMDYCEPKLGDMYYIISANWLNDFHQPSSEMVAETFGNADIIDPGTGKLIITSNPQSIFHAVPITAWNYFLAWYTSDEKNYYEIPRPIIADKHGEPTIDFYSALVSAKVFSQKPDVGGRTVDFSVSCPCLVSDLLNEVKKKVGLNDDDDIRFWNVQPDSTGIAVMKSPSLAQAPFRCLNKTLIDFGDRLSIEEFFDNTDCILIIVEVQNPSGKWPSEPNSSNSSTFGSTANTYRNPMPLNMPWSPNSDDDMTEDLDSNSDSETPETSAVALPPPQYQAPRVRSKYNNSHSSTYNNYRTIPVPQCEPGTMGLSNLGNTCYMNSALQCLTHVPELANYFVSGFYENEINRDNPIGYDGKIAEAFGGLLDHLVGSQASGSSYSCIPFRTNIGEYNSAFGGYQQQDSQEFLAFLLDGLHEDLNRILKKPATEKPELKNQDANNIEAIGELAEESWRRHLLRNDSVIVDLFAGLYKSTIVCPSCSLTSVTFDPFTDLTLPVPSNQVFSRNMKVFPKNRKPILLAVEMDYHCSMADLRSYIAKHCNINPDCLTFVDVVRNTFYKNIGEGPAAQNFTSNDDIFAYELDYPPFKLIPELSPDGTANPLGGEIAFPVSVYIYVVDDESERGEAADVPFYITLTPSEATEARVIILKILEKMLNFTQFDKLQGFIDSIKHTDVGIEDFKLFTPFVTYSSVVSRPFASIPPDIGVSMFERLKQIEFAKQRHVIPSLPPPPPPRPANHMYNQQATNHGTYNHNDTNDSYNDALDNYGSSDRPGQAGGSADSAGDISEGYSDFIKSNRIGNTDMDYDPNIETKHGNQMIGDGLQTTKDLSPISPPSSVSGIESPAPTKDGYEAIGQNPFTNMTEPDENGQFAGDIKKEFDRSNEDKPRPGLLGGSKDLVPESDESSVIKIGENGAADKELKTSSSQYAFGKGTEDDEFECDEEEEDNADVNSTSGNGASRPPSGLSIRSSEQQHFNLQDDDSKDVMDTSSEESMESGVEEYHDDSSASEPQPSIQLDNTNTYYGRPAGVPRERKYSVSTRDPSDVENSWIVGPSGLLIAKMFKYYYGRCTEDLTPQNFYDWVIPEEAAQIHREREAKRGREDSFTLDHCLDQFSKTEVLGEEDLWYCSSCKEQVRASKTIELWKTPDIFVVHLKRFSGYGLRGEKINTTVEFPIDGFDITERINNTKANVRFGGTVFPKDDDCQDMDGKKDDRLVYDLFAVDNHYGTLHAGHYTAYVKNYIDNKWYYFDDSSVKPANPENSIAGSAYLLFYRRRGTVPLGGKKMDGIWGEITERRRQQEELRQAEIEKEKARQQQHRSSARQAFTGSSQPGSNNSLANETSLDSANESRFPGTGRTLGSSTTGRSGNSPSTVQEGGAAALSFLSPVEEKSGSITDEENSDSAAWMGLSLGDEEEDDEEYNDNDDEEDIDVGDEDEDEDEEEEEADDDNEGEKNNENKEIDQDDNQSKACSYLFTPNYEPPKPDCDGKSSIDNAVESGVAESQPSLNTTESTNSSNVSLDFRKYVDAKEN